MGSVYNTAPAENHTACVPERTVINATRKGQEGKGGQHPGKPRVRLWGPGGRNHQVERHMNLGFVPEEMPHRGTPAGSPNIWYRTPGEKRHPPPAEAVGAGSISYPEGSGSGRSHGWHSWL